jgi:hypothetical protein
MIIRMDLVFLSFERVVNMVRRLRVFNEKLKVFGLEAF